VRAEKILLRNFRNIEELALDPSPEVNIIYGDNAQGKTNLLEAVWLFCGSKSFRGSRESELVRFGSETSRLHLDFYAAGRAQSAELLYGAEKKKIFINDIPSVKSSDLSGVFCAVVFSPDQLSMVKQGPGGRRRFLDVSLGQILPKYQKVLESYERILRQRAHVLRDSAAHPSLLELLEVWDSHLVQYGAYICDIRTRYTRKLQNWAREIYDGISSGREEFSICYRSTAAEEAPEGRGEWEALLTEALKKSRGEDLRLVSTTVGPHRDDLSILVNGVSARSFGSQGQQRSCVLALKLAECSLMENSIGEPPVVLLDDVMSELDDGRRQYLLNHLKDRQVFITCCDTEAFRPLREGLIIAIKDGKIDQYS